MGELGRRPWALHRKAAAWPTALLPPCGTLSREPSHVCIDSGSVETVTQQTRFVSGYRCVRSFVTRKPILWATTAGLGESCLYLFILSLTTHLRPWRARLANPTSSFELQVRWVLLEAPGRQELRPCQPAPAAIWSQAVCMGTRQVCQLAPLRCGAEPDKAPSPTPVYTHPTGRCDFCRPKGACGASLLKLLS